MADIDAIRQQVAQILEQRYFAIIQPLPQNWPPDQHHKNRLSRALAAFGIEKLAELSPAQAANTIVDGGNDNGLDAIYFDRQKNRLWVLQSKIGNAPDSGENKKFCDGIRDLVAGRFEKFNAAIARIQPEIEEALSTNGLQVVGCQIHQGEKLGPHAIADLDQLKAELNQFVARFDWRDINLYEVHGLLTSEHAIKPVNVQLTLEKWYGVEEPRRAFYGVVSASTLAEFYADHGKALFEKNIRHYLGAEEVNAAIAATVEDRPSELFYLHNGLTAVCKSISPNPAATNVKGAFAIEGFSIVNGAQTVGSIAASKTSKGSVSPDAKVLITLIEVGDGQDNLGAKVTRARNTQNSIKGLHFAALDPQQERLRQELMLSGVEYHYRPSEEALRTSDTLVTIEQAAITLASFSGQTKFVVAAKKAVGQLFDGGGEYYPALFRGDVSGVELIRKIRIYEFIDGILAASEKAEAKYSRRKMFYRHGRFFILHIFSRINQTLIRKPDIVLSESDKADISRAALDVAELIYTTAEATLGANGYLSVFRNMTDAEPLARETMKRWAAANVAKEANPPVAAQVQSNPGV
jgi:hypothetical protein